MEKMNKATRSKKSSRFFKLKNMPSLYKKMTKTEDVNYHVQLKTEYLWQIHDGDLNDNTGRRSVRVGPGAFWKTEDATMKNPGENLTFAFEKSGNLGV